MLKLQLIIEKLVISITKTGDFHIIFKHFYKNKICLFIFKQNFVCLVFNVEISKMLVFFILKNGNLNEKNEILHNLTQNKQLIYKTYLLLTLINLIIQ